MTDARIGETIPGFNEHTLSGLGSARAVPEREGGADESSAACHDMTADLNWAETYRETVLARVRACGSASGPLSEAGTHHFATSGSGLRIHLTLTAAAFAGASLEDSLAAATTVELVHNASLLHDDLMDRDGKRRGQPTVWARYGEETALLLGDRLLSAAFAESATTSRPAALVATLRESIDALIDGQAAEMAPLPPNPDPSVLNQRYLDTARRKSGTLFALAVEAGLLLADTPTHTRAAARNAFNSVGAAYQVLDDLADLEGTKRGRSEPSDLYQGRLTAPIVAYLAQASPGDAAAMLSVLAQEQRSHETVAAMQQTLLTSAAPAATRQRHADLVMAAEDAAATLPSGLQALLRWTIAAITMQCPKNDEKGR